MGIVIGIDVGGSTTKIVGFKNEGGRLELITPQLVKANDPITATYGAFGKFTDENNIRISDIDKVLMTGVGASHVKHNLYGIECVRVPEFDCIGRGGIYLSGLDRALVVSMGTGTAIVHAAADGRMEYLGGTGVGGGTFVGLSKLRHFTAGGFIDLQDIVENYGIKDKSLRKISGIVLGKKVSKAQRLSNWEAKTLTPQQQVYAATDAWVCVEIFHHLQ